PKRPFAGRPESPQPMIGGTMKYIAVMLLGLLAAAGCNKEEAAKMTPKSRDLGTGLNTVDRSYAKEPAEIISTVQTALRELDLRLESEKHDKLGGEIVAIRATGEKVTVKVKALAATQSSVSVRVDPGDRNLANRVHDKIAEELGIRPEEK